MRAIGRFACLIPCRDDRAMTTTRAKNGRTKIRQNHSTICQPDDLRTFGRIFGGRPARATSTPPLITRCNHGNINSFRPRYVQNGDEYSCWCGRITERAESGTPEILLIVRLSRFHNSLRAKKSRRLESNWHRLRPSLQHHPPLSQLCFSCRN